LLPWLDAEFVHEQAARVAEYAVRVAEPAGGGE